MSAETKVDSINAADVTTSSQPIAKPDVGCGEVSTQLTKKETFDIAMSMASSLNGLTVKEAKSVIDWLLCSIDDFSNNQKYIDFYFERQQVLVKNYTKRDLKL